MRAFGLSLAALGGLASAAVIAGALHPVAAKDDEAIERLARDPNARAAAAAFVEGQETFRFDTFGSEAFWGGQLRLHDAIAGAATAASATA
jgi:hypothetical protein